MATHDYVIANQGFPAFRSDLNDALAAIVSNNSSATEPTTMFAHMIWVDTAADPSVLKIRNADNDAWITIGTINQTGDTFTLTSAVSATTLNTSGAVVFNDAGADVDFRVEGDTDANLLFVDAGNDRVGVKTATPAVALDVVGQVRASTGILFGSDTAAANALDDYEEGTWTPTVIGSTTAGTVTYNYQVGSYTKIGRFIYIYIDLEVASFSGGAGILQISSIPFANVNISSTFAVFQPIAVDTAFAQTYATPTSFINPNSTAMTMYSCDDGHANFAGMKVNQTGRISGYVVMQTN